MQRAVTWGNNNRVAFTLEKLEMIHLIRKTNKERLCYVVNEELTIHPITTAPKEDEQPARQWLVIWFDQKLSFERHVAERAQKARKLVFHIHGLARTVDGPLASSLRKAVITCVLPSLLYGSEVWYGGRTKPPRHTRGGQVVDVVWLFKEL